MHRLQKVSAESCLPSFFHRSFSVRIPTLVFFILFLAACNSQSISTSSNGGYAINTVGLSPTWSGTLFEKGTPTLSALSISPTWILAHTTKPTSTMTAHPTIRPTPTSGLPPTATRSPKETCPPPTYEKVAITFAEEIEEYGPQILAYIRANGDRGGLKEQLEQLGRNVETIVNEDTKEKAMVFFPNRAQFTETDLTGDLSREIIVALKQKSGSNYDLGVFVVGCRDNQYQLLSDRYHFFSRWTLDGWSKILDIRDLNANGIQEIILSAGHLVAPGEVFVDTSVLEWNGMSFRSLIDPVYEDPIYWGNTSLNGFIEFRDIDGNGTTELLFPWHLTIAYCGKGPISPWAGVFMWDGRYYRFIWRDPGDPEYRFQAAFNGDYYSQIHLYDQAEESYRRAINDSSLRKFSMQEWSKEALGDWCTVPIDTEPGEPQRIIAYARLRLLELNVFQQKMAAAESGWIFISENYTETNPGYRYAILAKTFWETYQSRRNIADACAAVKNQAAQDQEGILGPLHYGESAIPGPTVETICPFL
jgi:hypothetical protein